MVWWVWCYDAWRNVGAMLWVYGAPRRVNDRGVTHYQGVDMESIDQGAREARYAEAINHTAVTDSAELLRDLTDAVMAVADAEVAAACQITTCPAPVSSGEAATSEVWIDNHASPDDEFGRGVRHAAALVRAFDQNQTGWHLTFDRDTALALAAMLDDNADHRAKRLGDAGCPA